MTLENQNSELTTRQELTQLSRQAISARVAAQEPGLPKILPTQSTAWRGDRLFQKFNYTAAEREEVAQGLEAELQEIDFAAIPAENRGAFVKQRNWLLQNFDLCVLDEQNVGQRYIFDLNYAGDIELFGKHGGNGHMRGRQLSIAREAADLAYNVACAPV